MVSIGMFISHVIFSSTPTLPIGNVAVDTGRAQLVMSRGFFRGGTNGQLKKDRDAASISRRGHATPAQSRVESDRVRSGCTFW